MGQWDGLARKTRGLDVMVYAFQPVRQPWHHPRTVQPRAAVRMLPCVENGAHNGRLGRLWNAALSGTLRLAEEL